MVMSYEVIITEKPSSANKIAYALSDGKFVKKSINGVPYYELERNGKKIIVVSAVGHLYTIAEKNKTFDYPIFDIEWRPTSEIDKKAAFSKKYLDVIKKLSKDADEFTIATDYDIEGETIGYNILRFVCNTKDANRMKFSTVTFEELKQSYENKNTTIDWGQAKAGETRHMLDWFYGINLSRALMGAFKTTGEFTVLSSGRVQGPALKIIIDREKEIETFKPQEYWQIELKCRKGEKRFSAWHEKEKFTDKSEAEKVVKNCKKKETIIKEIVIEKKKVSPPYPFDLGTLQSEVYRCFGISPKETLTIAQNLYSSGYISYPRTSSQQLPFSIGFKKILSMLAKQDKFKLHAEELMKKEKLSPRNGSKTDPAHPAIFPTGYVPQKLSQKEEKIYSLIVYRFLSTLSEPAIREHTLLKIDCNKEIFIAKGSKTIEKNWYNFYPFLNVNDEILPSYVEGEKVDVEKIEKHTKHTQPPPRYTLATIIKELEKRCLGTKATRADIIDSLFKRGYIKGKNIQPTELGRKITEALERYIPKIVDEELTRHFEIELEDIRTGKEDPNKVIEESKNELTKIIEDFKKSEKEIGEILAEAKEKENNVEIIGKCPVCKDGNLVIKVSKRFRRRFISCDRYPECKIIFNIPQKVSITFTKDICKECNHPLVIIKEKEVCINSDCPLIKKDYENAVKRLGDKKCPLCNSPLYVRKSLTGLFVGCSRYPKCKHIENI